MSWVWLAWVRDPHQLEQALGGPVAPLGRARLISVSDGGLDLGDQDLGELIAWPAGRKPTPDAVRADARVVDPEGEPGWVSLIVVPAARAPLFDDPGVSAALRAVLAGPPADAVTTFVRDATRFAGAVTVRRRDPDRLRDDPFARLARPVVARVAGGLFGRTPPPAGPVIQRYAGQPWPAAGFPQP